MITISGKVIRLEDVPLRDVTKSWWTEKGGTTKDQGRFKELISRETCGSSDLMFGVAYMSPGEVHPLHNHPDAAEFYYMLSGQCKLTVGEEEVDASQGMAFYFPRGCNHKIVVDGGEEITFVYGYDKPDFAECGCVWVE